MVKCEYCGKEVVLPFKCSYCGGKFCIDHHLPEKHECPALVRGVWQPRYVPVEPPPPEPPRRVRIGYPKVTRPYVYFYRGELLSLLLAATMVFFVFLTVIPWSPIWILTIFIGSVTCYVSHELAHKFVAQSYGHRARYVLSPMGVLLTLISMIPFMPIKIIAPGYVSIIPMGAWSTEQEGRIALAGPILNILIAAFFTILARIIPIARVIANINATIAFINLMPFPVLDGAKIMRWSFLIWVTMFVVSLVLLAVNL
ncbi:MAG: hypothetical protein DRJ49_05140 [Thermoprotei archaeon]|nr:MAG: hypothetical protein DRJ49_05140 [Thermoprotei archaeon]